MFSWRHACLPPALLKPWPQCLSYNTNNSRLSGPRWWRERPPRPSWLHDSQRLVSICGSTASITSCRSDRTQKRSSIVRLHVIPVYTTGITTLASGTLSPWCVPMNPPPPLKCLVKLTTSCTSFYNVDWTTSDCRISLSWLDDMSASFCPATVVTFSGMGVG